MLQPIYTNQFKKDIKRDRKRGKDLKILKEIACLLMEEKSLSLKNRDHKLGGNFNEYRECHLDPDWLLIYKIEAQNIFFVRTGTHSDLFK